MALTHQLQDLVGAIEAEADPARKAALLCELARAAIDTMRLKPLPSDHPALLPAVANLKRAADGVVGYFASLEQEIRESFPMGVRDAFASLEVRVTDLARTVEGQQTDLGELRRRRDELERMEQSWNRGKADSAVAEAAIARLEALKQEVESLPVAETSLRATDAMASTWGSAANHASNALRVMLACANDFRVATEANQRVADSVIQAASLITLPTAVPEEEIRTVNRKCSEVDSDLAAVDLKLLEIDRCLSLVLAFHREALNALHVARGGL